MSVRVIDPQEMIREEVRNRFDVKMHSNLCVPSFMHAYSMGIEFARDWFLTTMPVNFFKKESGTLSVNVNDSHIYDDYRRFNRRELLKKEKPYLLITPNMNLEFDLDSVHAYNYGPYMLTRRGWSDDSFFIDEKHGLYLLMNMQLCEMATEFRITLDSRAQQYDLYKKMELWFRIGATQTEDRDMDFHIPDQIICNIATGAGFSVSTTTMTVDNPLDFTRYMNMHSAFPILYKYRKATGNYEYFIRIPMLQIHINLMDKLGRGDGENQGMLKTNYDITMNAIFRFPAPHFYVYYTKNPTNYDIPKYEELRQPNSMLWALNTYKMVDIPFENEKGWEKFVWSKYEFDENDDGIIKLDDMIGFVEEPSEFFKVLKYTRDTIGVSPSVYIEIRLYNSDPDLPDYLDYDIDWNKMQIVIPGKIEPQMIYIALYVDMDYYHSICAGFDDYAHTRMKKKEDQSEPRQYLPAGTKKLPPL